MPRQHLSGMNENSLDDQIYSTYIVCMLAYIWKQVKPSEQLCLQFAATTMSRPAASRAYTSVFSHRLVEARENIYRFHVSQCPKLNILHCQVRNSR